MSDDQLLRVAAAGKRLAAWAESITLDAVAGFCDRRGPESIPAGRAAADRAGGVRTVRYGADGTPAVEEFAADEVAVALTLSPGTARNLLGHALDLRHRFPRVRAALAVGTVDGFRARIVTNTTSSLDHPTATRMERRSCRNWPGSPPANSTNSSPPKPSPPTPTAPRPTSPASASFKGVWPTGAHPGLAGMTAELDTDAMARLDQTISTVARLLRRTGRTEPWQQLRADALGMLADPTTITTLHSNAAAATPTDTGDSPAGERAGDPAPGRGGSGLPATVLYLHAHPDGRYELDGCGPITTSQAQRILRHSNVVIKPVIDLNHHLATEHYQIPEPIKDIIQIRDRTCRFPGCPRPARSCQTDHTIPWPHGPTTLTNLCCLCTRHHRMKTHTRWQLAQPFPGILAWRSPTGTIHIVDQRGTTHLDRAPPAGTGSDGL